jgi:hypothetical protein
MIARRRMTKGIGVTCLAAALSAFLMSLPGHSQPLAPAEQLPAMPSVKTIAPYIPLQERSDWRRTMSQKPVPNTGCFEAAHPSTEWKEVPCGKPPPYPYPPSIRSSVPAIIGGAASGFSAQKAGITLARGSFASYSSAPDESGQIGGKPPLIANVFSLQLNTNTIPNAQLPAALCQGTACIGWQQFVYSNTGSLFIQYWLINYGLPVPPGGARPACPIGWTFFGGVPGIAASGCFRNGANAARVDPQPISQISHLSLSGQTNAGQDTATMEIPGKIITDVEVNVLNLAGNWNTAEFNIFGDCCNSQAHFGASTALWITTETDGAATTHPACVRQSFTAETNNLSLVPAGWPPDPTMCFEYDANVMGGNGPMINFSEATTGAFPENVLCYVYNDGFTNAAGPSDAIFINGQGQACIPDLANGTCRKWFGHCIAESSGVAVNFSVFDDSYVNAVGSDSIYVNQAGQSCVPDPGPNGICRKWFGLGVASDGRPASCTVFDDGYTNRNDRGDAILFNAAYQACIPGLTCRKWWGICHAY